MAKPPPESTKTPQRQRLGEHTRTPCQAVAEIPDISDPVALMTAAPTDEALVVHEGSPRPDTAVRTAVAPKRGPRVPLLPVIDDPVLPVLEELSHRYEDAGHRLALTGGATRDFLLGRRPRDFDLISDANQDDTETLLTDWAGNSTRSFDRFGVVSATHGAFKLQVLTFHTPRDWYPAFDPALLHEDPLHNQLLCADLTINTGALLFPGARWIDPYGAATDVATRILRPPIDPFVTIPGNPRTMVRYARFAAELGFNVAPDVLAAMTEHAAKIGDDLDWQVIMSLTKIVTAPHPEAGMAILRDTTVLDYLPAEWRPRLEF
ncbi:hypothetical protein AB0J82_35005 [Asanoa sp. NPDC049518]|uniref:hypothetical protein n=1 Tax=unclassified Asanoa TaxID=2685164 RepID=UPI00344A9F81